MMKTVLFVIPLLLVIAESTTSDSELLSVVVVYRHGDRTPVYTYANDPYPTWPVDLGQLTTRGKIQHYKLGQWFRQRYNGFLSGSYDNNEIYIRSSDIDRTIMSALSNLAGLYPPHGAQVWNPFIRWQPIPVRTIPTTYDNLLLQIRSCAKYTALNEEFTNSTYYQELSASYEDIFTYLSNHTGENMTDISYGFLMYDSLRVQETYNLTLPEWAQQVYPEPLKTMADISLSLQTATPQMARLKVGRLLYEIVDQFDSILNGTDTQKFIMYSAHDSTLANILNSIGKYDEIPPFASSLIFELRRNSNESFVNILYRKDTDLQEIVLDDCGAFDCSLDSLKSTLSPLLISESEWEEECAED